MREIIVYGSYARGTQNEESDVDIAVILSSKPSAKATDRMIDCVSGYELECNRVLSVIDIQESQYEDWKENLPFYRNIDKEGITVWKAT